MFSDSFSISDVYCVGKDKLKDQKGISLRFPRFSKVREDKNVQQATSCDEVNFFLFLKFLYFLDN